MTSEDAMTMRRFTSIAVAGVLAVSKSVARNGWVSKIGATRAPAAPAHAMPTPAVTA
jgi:hypothetical protein